MADSQNIPLKKPAIPRSIWALGFVSMFMDISSELIHSLLPLFMVSMLGASMTLVGLVEGITEAAALITKIFSGTLSDYLRKRKALAVFGYGIAALTKPLFPLAETIGMVLTARFMDRIGKGIRGAPRDALIGDISPPEIRGACFGLRQSLDTVGAFCGPLLAIAGMLYFADDIRAVLWIAVIPAFIAVSVLIFGVKEPEQQLDSKIVKKWRFRDIRYVGRAYWGLVAVAGVLTLARFSEAFLILKAYQGGLPMAWVPLVLVVMSIAYAISSYPVGILSDKIGRQGPLLVGVIFLIIADVILAFSDGLLMLVPGIILWGLHMGFTQGLLVTIVTDVTPANLRGTAYGVYNFICGLAMLLASVIAGMLWDSYGAIGTFLTGAGFAAVALMGLLVLQNKIKRQHFGS